MGNGEEKWTGVVGVVGVKRPRTDFLWKED
jgi:hypothetical protein